MRWLDEQFLKTPFYGARRMVAVMRRDGFVVNRKRVKRLMRVMGIAAIYQKPNTSLGHPAHKVYPYLLRGLVIDRANQVWCADITYVPMAKGFVYLVAVMDWFSRRVLSWRVSITMDLEFCVAALREAMEQHGRPEIFNTDQGVQFTSADFLAGLEAQAVRISMDGKGRYLDNIFIERLWRSLKYEEIFLKAYGSPAEARSGIGAWLSFYNDERPHQTHGYRTPREVFTGVTHGYVDNVRTLTTYPQAQQQQEKAFNDLNIKVSIVSVTPRRAGDREMAESSLHSARFLSNRWGPPQSISLPRSLGATRTCLSATEPYRSQVDYAEKTFDGSSIVDHQTRRDLFRVSGAAGLGLVASRAILTGTASAESAALVQAQPNPSSVAGDQTTADIIVETLITWGVSVIFGMVGDGIGPLIEAFSVRQDKIRYIAVRHEEAAAFMACGYAKHTGRLGVCIATTGPVQSI